MPCAGSDPHAAPRYRLFGRHRTRRLRPGRRDLLANRLPALRLDPGPIADLPALFATPVRAVWLEIGFGAGEHLATLASAHRDIGFIGAEPYRPGVAALLAEAEARHLANIRIVPDDIRPFFDHFPAGGFDRIHILFPDPWPKRRHHGRRLIRPDILDRLAGCLRRGGELRLATDDPDYQGWMLRHVHAHPDFAWLARRRADWEHRPADWPETRYERKSRLAGRHPVFLRIGRL